MWTRSGKTVQNSSLNQSAFKSWGPQIFCGAYLIVGPSLLLMYVSKIIKVFCVSLQCYFSNRERISRSYSSCLLIEFISKMCPQYFSFYPFNVWGVYVNIYSLLHFQYSFFIFLLSLINRLFDFVKLFQVSHFSVISHILQYLA